jgi:hypothetical protein
MLTVLAETVRRKTAPPDGLIVIPEGEILNYLSGRRNPIPHKLYIPGYLSTENERAILDELERARPASVVILNRETSEYGRRLFGKNHGAGVAAWIEANYELAPTPAAPGARLYFRKR